MAFGRRPDSTDHSQAWAGAAKSGLAGILQNRFAGALIGAAAFALFFAWRYPAPPKPVAIAEDAAAIADGPLDPDVSRLRRFPNVAVTWYDVPGTDPRAITDYMRQHGPVDGNDGFRAQGLTSWRVNWQFPPSGDGRCSTSGVKLIFSGTVLLPRLTEGDKLSPRTRAAWRKMMARLVAHEEGHLHLSYSQMDRLADAVRRSTCDNARAAADAVIAEINARNVEYDRETQHGSVDSDKFPPL